MKMEQGRMTPREFEKLSNEVMNKRVGNFLYVHDDHVRNFGTANPPWYCFQDIYCNSVTYGSDNTDVIVRIQKNRRESLGRIIVAYMKELVGRHDETLHEFGTQKFHGVTIELPPDLAYPFLHDMKVIIHTGSGCCYDQDEIAYEVMAALSDVPVLKALAPRNSYCGFDRCDNLVDSNPIRFRFESTRIFVKFNHEPNSPLYVVVGLYDNPTKEKLDKFKNLMYDFVDGYVQSRTGQNIVRKEGVQEFKYEHSEKMVYVRIVKDLSYDFCVTVPYCDHEPFARLNYAKRVMEMLYENFKVEKEVEVI